MKKTIALILITATTAVTILSLVACSDKGVDSDRTQKTMEKSTETSVEIPNPFEECDTLEDASKIAGFEFTLPDVLDDYSERTIQAIKDNMIEVIYSNGENEIHIRKALGSEDISGDYNEYEEKNTIKVDNLQINMRGNEGNINVATWTKGDYTYSLSVSAKMNSDSVVKLIQDIQ